MYIYHKLFALSICICYAYAEYYNDGSQESTVKRTVHLFKTRLISVVRKPPGFIYGTAVSRPEHHSDIVRMEVMLLYGGLYGDTDIVAVRSFDALLNYSITMGRDAPGTVSNGIIFAHRGAPYLYLFHYSYRTFKTSEWVEHSTVGNQEIYRRCPELLRVESRNLIVPDFTRRKDMFNVSISLNLDAAYSIHVWHRDFPFEPNPMLLLMWNCSAATVFRNTYYGYDMIAWPRHVNSTADVAKCALAVTKVEESVLGQISKSVEVPLFVKASDSGGVNCAPLTEKVACSSLANSTLPCTKDFVIEQFNYHSQHPCLMTIVNELYAETPTVVPRLFHLVWYYGENTTMRFHQYLSVVSILKFFRPRVLFLWNAGNLPSGKWWHELIGHLNGRTSESATYQGNIRPMKEGRVADWLERLS